MLSLYGTQMVWEGIKKHHQRGSAVQVISGGRPTL